MCFQLVLSLAELTTEMSHIVEEIPPPPSAWKTIKTTNLWHPYIWKRTWLVGVWDRQCRDLKGAQRAQKPKTSYWRNQEAKNLRDEQVNLCVDCRLVSPPPGTSLPSSSSKPPSSHFSSLSLTNFLLLNIIPENYFLSRVNILPYLHDSKVKH